MTLINKDFVIYTKTIQLAQIVEIHYDDHIPYYTIRFSNKSECQTIAKYLKKIKIEI
jgi:hypothetical protein